MPNDLDKIVKLACKPKNAPPKSKYVDVLVSATFSDDGSLQDIVRSLSLRLREPNAVVVFKALITLHQMIRSGSTDSLMEVLSQGNALRLGNVSGQNWEGYSPPAAMGAYAKYLDARIKAWKELKQDPVRVQTESNRRSDGLGAGSKARRLRHLPVEKGLLREVKQVQQVLMVLIECRFFDDDLRDENTIIAFRMLIKDLLVLFQAGNEGVCNILEHYFEMSKIDATEAFSIYKQFIAQTDKVVDYLSVVRKLHNIVNVPVPNLKHAPTSLVKALEEYLNDPNFEENRREYKRSLGVVEGTTAGRETSPAPKTEPPKPTSSSSAPAPASSTSAASPSTTTAAPPPGASQKIQDFFESIQADQQPTMFGGPAQPFQPQQFQQPFQQQQIPFQHTGMQQAAGFNPFRQSMMMPQQTGFMQPQQTGFSPFPQSQQQPPQQPFQQPQQTGTGGFLQPQLTGMMAFGTGSLSGRGGAFPQPQQQQQPFQSNFAQPQPQPLLPQSTGSNPFRQSMFINPSVNPSGALSQPTSPFPGMGGSAGGQGAFGGASAFGANATGQFGGGNNASGPGSSIQRPGSTPALSNAAKPLVPQATGSKNPFAPPGGVPQPAPAAPKGPSMNELAWQKTGQAGQNQFGQGFGGGTTSSWAGGASLSGKPNVPGANAANGTEGISSIASSFVDFSKPTSPPNTNGSGTGTGSTDFLSQFGSLSVNTGSNTGTTSQFGSLSSNPPGATSLSPTKTGASSGSSGFLQPQQTGFGGSTVKRFQPTSSFGSQLLENLPPIAEPGAGGNGTPNGGATSPLGGGASAGGTGGMQSQMTGYPFGQTQPGQLSGQQQGQHQGLSAQMTGAPNPFRQSMFAGAGGGGLGAQPTGAFGGGAFGASSPFTGQQNRTGLGQPPQQSQQPPQQQSSPFGAFGQQGAQQGGSLI